MFQIKLEIRFASDLLSQAEHGPDSQVILVTNDIKIADTTFEKVAEQLEKLDEDIAKKALDNSKVIFFDNSQDVIDFINLYGAEHLIVCMDNETDFVNQIKNAGSVFIGNYTPESAGDYASGTNHTLPTNGYTKQYSGVNLDSFLKAITYQKITANGLINLGPVIETMASAEGLQAQKCRINPFKNIKIMKPEIIEKLVRNSVKSTPCVLQEDEFEDFEAQMIF